MYQGEKTCQGQINVSRRKKHVKDTEMCQGEEKKKKQGAKDAESCQGESNV